MLQNKNVCRDSFLRLYGISSKRLRIIQSKKVVGELDLSDKRGGSRRSTSEETLALAKAHLLSIPHVRSHYTRSRLKYFTNSSLTIESIFGAFKEFYKLKKDADCPVSRSYYYAFFKRSGFRIRKPRTDTCNYCAKAKVIILWNRASKLKTGLMMHEAKVRRYKAEKKKILEACKQPHSRILALEFDYGQNLPLPKLSVTDQFYKRLLWVYVLNIHCHNDDKSYLFWYLETESRKNSNSVVSLLYFVICRLIKPHTKQIVLLSDSCGGQNKNILMVQFSLWIARTFNVSVVHIFPVRGHSYNVCDRNFGSYSRQLRKVENVYVVKEYVNVMKRARKKNPFRVIYGANKIKDWGPFLSSQFKAKGVNKHARFAIRSYVKMQYTTYGTVLASVSYSSVFRPFNFLIKGRNIANTFTMESVPGQISVAKKKDVLDLMTYVPKDARKWFRRQLK